MTSKTKFNVRSLVRTGVDGEEVWGHFAGPKAIAGGWEVLVGGGQLAMEHVIDCLAWTFGLITGMVSAVESCLHLEDTAMVTPDVPLLSLTHGTHTVDMRGLLADILSLHHLQYPVRVHVHPGVDPWVLWSATPQAKADHTRQVPHPTPQHCQRTSRVSWTCISPWLLTVLNSSTELCVSYSCELSVALDTLVLCPYG